MTVAAASIATRSRSRRLRVRYRTCRSRSVIAVIGAGDRCMASHRWDDGRTDSSNHRHRSSIINHFYLFRRQEDGEEESSAESPPQVGNQNKAKEWQLFAAQAFADIRPSSQGELLMGILLRSLVLLWDVVYFISNLAYLGTCIQLVFLYVYLRRSYV